MKHFFLLTLLASLVLVSNARAEYRDGGGEPLTQEIVEQIHAQLMKSNLPQNKAYQDLRKQLKKDSFDGLLQCELYDQQYKVFSNYEKYPIAHNLHCWLDVSRTEKIEGKEVSHILRYKIDGLLLTNFQDFRVFVIEIEKRSEGFLPFMGGKSSSSGG